MTSFPLIKPAYQYQHRKTNYRILNVNIACRQIRSIFYEQKIISMLILLCQKFYHIASYEIRYRGQQRQLIKIVRNLRNVFIFVSAYIIRNIRCPLYLCQQIACEILGVFYICVRRQHSESYVCIIFVSAGSMWNLGCVLYLCQHISF